MDQQAFLFPSRSPKTSLSNHVNHDGSNHSSGWQRINKQFHVSIFRVNKINFMKQCCLVRLTFCPLAHNWCRKMDAQDNFCHLLPHWRQFVRPGRGSKPRCYQTTSCFQLFSSSLTDSEVPKQLLIGGIRKPQTTVKTRGGEWWGWKLRLWGLPVMWWGGRDLWFLFRPQTSPYVSRSQGSAQILVFVRAWEKVQLAQLKKETSLMVPVVDYRFERPSYSGESLRHWHCFPPNSPLIL